MLANSEDPDPTAHYVAPDHGTVCNVYLSSNKIDAIVILVNVQHIVSNFLAV